MVSDRSTLVTYRFVCDVNQCKNIQSEQPTRKQVHSEPGYNEVVRSDLFFRYIQVFIISRFPLYKKVLFNFITVSFKAGHFVLRYSKLFYRRRSFRQKFTVCNIKETTSYASNVKYSSRVVCRANLTDFFFFNAAKCMAFVLTRFCHFVSRHHDEKQTRI